MSSVKLGWPPGIFLAEVLEPSDPFVIDSKFDGAKSKELEYLRNRGVYEIVFRMKFHEMPIFLNTSLSCQSRTKIPMRSVSKLDRLGRVTKVWTRATLFTFHLI